MVKPLFFSWFVCSARIACHYFIKGSQFFGSFIVYVLLLSFSSSQTAEANTSADEPLTTKEGAHLQDIDGLAAIVGTKQF